jgi:hypothetical protein
VVLPARWVLRRTADAQTLTLPEPLARPSLDRGDAGR